MKTALLAATTVALAALAAPAHADFTGPTAPANWTTTTTGSFTRAGSVGSATFSSSQLTLVGGNVPGSTDVAACVGATYGFLGPCEIRTTIALPGSFSFHWAYTTADDAGPAGDIFGYVLNGVHTQLSNPGGAVSQSGDLTFLSGSSFGWFMNCTDCTGGAATATITNFTVAAIPEPSELALMAAGLVALGGFARRRRAAR